MTIWTLFRRSLRFYRRTNVSVLLAVAVSTSVLVGALVVGDSVRYSLRSTALLRLGQTKLAMLGQNRFFRTSLTDELARELNTNSAGVLALRGLVSNSDGSRQAGRVEVLGVDERFWKMGPSGNVFDIRENEIILSEPLAQQLGAGRGDEVVLWVTKPSLLPRDAVLSTATDNSAAMRLKVSVIVCDADFGRFSLAANQTAPLNAYMDIAVLGEKVDLAGRANMLLLSDNAGNKLSIENANAAVKSHWRLADGNIQLRELSEQNVIELRCDRIFLEKPLVEAATSGNLQPVGILSYFVNETRLGDRTTPYSIITAMGNSRYIAGVIPPDMSDDEIIINDWLKEDLQAKVGDVIELTYFVDGPMRKLKEQTNRFRIRAVVAMEGIAADRELMPDFAGLSDVENCRDWQPGISIDLKKIRDKDQDYWKTFRGTPKAFVTLAAGQQMWSNRFGNLTALRYPLTNNSRDKIENAILQKLDPQQSGFYFQPVRSRTYQASSEAMDFEWLFLGFSFFLIVAALLLTGLLFVLGIEHRSEEVGTLLAVGFSARRVRMLLLMEGAALALLGAIAGAGAGSLYTCAMLGGLETVWRDAIGSSIIYFHAQPTTLVIGCAAGILTALSAMQLTLRHQARYRPRRLLSDDTSFLSDRSVTNLGKRKIGLWIAVIAGIAAVTLLGTTGPGAGAFFGAGGLLLLAMLGMVATLLNRLAVSAGKKLLTLPSLALRNCTRRRSRSLAIVALLACGVFIVVAVGANRRDLLKDAEKRSSGTGGFALMGEATLPVYYDLNSSQGRKAFGLEAADLKDVKVVHLRLRDGDDASCLNLNRPQTPQLLAVQPEQLNQRKAFTFLETIDNSLTQTPWLLLEQNYGDDVVPAIADAATIKWALGKSVGDDLTFTDEQGAGFKIRLVGAIKNSILQGSLLIAENTFIRRYPSEEGYRMFLIDAPADAADRVSQALSRALRNVALSLGPTEKKLAAFYAVESTYLSIFQVLGGLGLLLGSVALGLVVLRNVLERRGEFAMLRAVGFDRPTLRRLILYEHCTPLLLGLICGIGAALVAILPALRQAGEQIPWFSLTFTLVAIAFSGIMWTWLAAVLALRGDPMQGLRNE